MQNLGSDVAVKVDGKELEKDNQVSVGPGSKIAFGDEAVFQASSCASVRSCILVTNQPFHVSVMCVITLT